MYSQASTLSISHKFFVPDAVADFITQHGLYDEDVELVYDSDSQVVIMTATVACYD
jgi:hypothetical protein